jgi:2-dehydro-3-deoxygalactonokinase
LFAVLSRHSILGRLMPDNAPAGAEEAEAAFLEGLGEARKSLPGDLPHQLFAARTLGLTRRLPAETLKDYLSGLLIGHELASGLVRMHATLAEATPLLLIGEQTLCRRYARALGAMGVKPAAQLENTAPQGLFRFAVAAGLVARA